MKRNGFIVVCIFAAAVLLIGSCAKPYHTQNERYVFVATNIDLPYWQLAQAGFLDAAKELGVRAEMIGPKGYQPNAELVVFRQTVEEQPTGICLSAARPEIFKEQINKAIAAGVPVICVDADSPDSNRLSYIGTDNNRAGRESVKQMANLLSGGGKIVVLSIPGQINLDDRVAGVAEALANYPAIKLIDIIDDKGDVKVAAEQVFDVMKGKDKVDGFISVEATGGEGAAEALHALKLEGKVPIVAFDDDPKTLDLIDQGVIAATIAQKPYVMSYYALKLLDDLHHGAVHQFKDWKTALAPPMPIFLDTGTVTVDKNNVKAYREELPTHTKTK
ncbi:MAG TPA: substrate-binding domain-containing protein [Candidatus Saccharimonadales bacterium]|nr:substrate-binding domain-containing protein [Candidatus Saccharimonadales bacterium]